MTLRYAETMRTIVYSQICLSAALLALVSCATGPTYADKMGVGDFDPVDFYPNLPPVPSTNASPQLVTHPADAKCAASVDDIDESPAMQKLWSAWHKRVAEIAYRRFIKSIEAGSLFAHSPPLSCQVTYTVGTGARISDVRILQPSPDKSFDLMLIKVLQSFNGDPDLKFPQDSRLQAVTKTGTFTWHYSGGHGFKGDFCPEEIFRLKKSWE
jgi:hypothetical protein